jgi:hypothetical protein
VEIEFTDEAILIETHRSGETEPIEKVEILFELPDHSHRPFLIMAFVIMIMLAFFGVLHFVTKKRWDRKGEELEELSEVGESEKKKIVV